MGELDALGIEAVLSAHEIVPDGGTVIKEEELWKFFQTKH